MVTPLNSKPKDIPFKNGKINRRGQLHILLFERRDNIWIDFPEK